MPPPLPEAGGFRDFIETVAQRSFGAAFCMFRDADPSLERGHGPAIRRANATAYLNARSGRAPLLLVGEAMGYAGGRFSGIAFTAERTLMGWGEPFEATSLRPEGWAEQSGTIVHGTLATLGIAPDTVLWNVVPAHPHRPGAPLTNRAPTVPEVAQGASVLDAVIALLEPRTVVAVGRIAERLLGERADAAVRHPAQGGATACRAGLARVLAG
jgi:uracil-DNA glycosylase